MGCRGGSGGYFLSRLIFDFLISTELNRRCVAIAVWAALLLLSDVSPLTRVGEVGTPQDSLIATADQMSPSKAYG